MSEENLPAVQEQTPKVPVAMTEEGVALTSLEDAWRFAQGVIQGRMAPKGVTHPGAVVALIQAGRELGLPPMQALSNLTFINGRLGIMGDAARALIHQKKLAYEGLRVTYEGTPYEDDFAAIVTSRRVGEVTPVSTRFSVADAKKAHLWDKSGPWSEYPKRMLMYRALGFHVRDQYPDVMMGATLTEELRDHPDRNVKGRPERDVTPPAGPDPLLAEEPVIEPEIVDTGLELEEEPMYQPGAMEEEEFALEPPPDCDHPDGFSATEDSPVPICIHCGVVQDG